MITKAYDEFAAKIDFLFAGGGHPSHWRQEPYRGDFFRIFWNNRTLSGDQISTNLRQTFAAIYHSSGGESNNPYSDLYGVG